MKSRDRRGRNSEAAVVNMSYKYNRGIWYLRVELATPNGGGTREGCSEKTSNHDRRSTILTPLA